MSYVVLARKYRPLRFGDSVGQPTVVRTLRNAVAQGKVSHAYLFCGPRGVGKTSMARILSKTLNCPHVTGEDPCCQCEICKAVGLGEDVDVLEIDGASNRGVGEIGKIRENVKFRPARSRYKIYIIDEVHMLTREAFNALLKTLEEPPAHVKFIFATTEPHKVPDTIQSRCQILPFHKIRPDQIKGRLADICIREGFEVDGNVLGRISHQCLGGLRDALSLLDRLVAAGKKRVTEADLAAALGILSTEALARILSAVLRRDDATILREVSAFDRAGGDYEELLVDLGRTARAAMHHSLLGERAQLPAELGLRPEALESLSGFDTDAWLFVLENLHETMQNLRYALDERVAVELTLLKLARVGDMASVHAWLERLDELARRIEGGVRKASPTVSDDALQQAPSDNDVPPRAAPARALHERQESAAEGQALAAGSPQSSELPPTPQAPNPEAHASTLRPLWERLLRALRLDKKATVATLLGRGEPVCLRDGVLRLKIRVLNDFERERLKSGDALEAIKRLSEPVFGVALRLKFEEYTAENTGPEDKLDALRADPAVQRVVETFDGQIVPPHLVKRRKP